MYVNQCGWSPLHRAASIGVLDTINLLLDRGAEIDAQNKVTGTSPSVYYVPWDTARIYPTPHFVFNRLVVALFHLVQFIVKNVLDSYPALFLSSSGGKYALVYRGEKRPRRYSCSS